MPTLQKAVATQNGALDSFETVVGPSPLLRIYTGAQPATCATARSGTKLVEMTLPSDWLAAASSGLKVKLGTWSGTGLAAGNAGHFALMDSGGTTCHLQGTITATGGGGDMTLDNIVIAVSQAVAVSTFSLDDGND